MAFYWRVSNLNANLPPLLLTFTRSVIGCAVPCEPLSSKYGDDEKVKEVACEERTMLMLGCRRENSCRSDVTSPVCLQVTCETYQTCL